jgi:hypothetical protein
MLPLRKDRTTMYWQLIGNYIILISCVSLFRIISPIVYFQIPKLSAIYFRILFHVYSIVLCCVGT